jgi:hypothetical protein
VSPYLFSMDTYVNLWRDARPPWQPIPAWYNMAGSVVNRGGHQ